jgi:hypothetical protein
MFSPDAVTFKDVADALYDFTAISIVVAVVWKSRGFYDWADTFLKRVVRHMDVMEQSMSVLMTNHAPHIEAYLKSIAVREQNAAGEENVEDNHRVAR